MPAERKLALRRRCALAALAGMLSLIVAAQAGLSAWLEAGPPRLRDPEYGSRLARLRQRRAEQPERPLVLVLGSSRVAMGVRPAPFDDPPAPGRPRLFNFALVGAGPVMELMCLHRLLADGVRPDRLLVEIWPPYLYEEFDKHELARLDVNRLNRADVELLAPYSPDPADLRRGWRDARLAPWSAHRFTLLNRVAPSCVPWMKRNDYAWRQLDNFGWLPAPEEVPDPAARRLSLSKHYEFYGPIFRDYKISPVADRALRELLWLARRVEVPVSLLYLPEATEFRGWYSLTMWAAVTDYLGRLCREQAVPLIDAREWAEDRYVPDGFHLSPEGARRFTARLWAEVLAPGPASAGSAREEQP
jgi:hypothetical protein